jgi:hypothetical protein
MQKMMKLSDTHYILVDDEGDIKVGDIVVEKLLTGRYELFEIHTLNDIDKSTQKKVTHSTQSLLDVVMWLYEKHGIWISVDPDNDIDTWFYTISHGTSTTVFGNYSGPIEVYEKGIEHVLNSMI